MDVVGPALGERRGGLGRERGQRGSRARRAPTGSGGGAARAASTLLRAAPRRSARSCAWTSTAADGDRTAELVPPLVRVRARVTVPEPVVPARDVPGAAREEEALRPRDRLLDRDPERPGEVGVPEERLAAHQGRVTGERRDDRERTAVGGVDAQHRDAVVDRPLAADAVHRDAGRVAAAPADAGGHTSAPGGVHRAREPLREPLGVAREHRGVDQPGDRRAAREARRAVVVARVDEDGLGRDPGEPPHEPPHVCGEVRAAKTRSQATIASGERPSSRTSAWPSIGSWTPSARPLLAAQQPWGSPHGGVMSTRETPAVSGHGVSSRLIGGRRARRRSRGGACAARTRGSRARGRARRDRGRPRPRRVCVPASERDELRPVGAEDVGAADVRRVAVEADLVGERGEDGVVARERVVEPRRDGRPVEQLLLGAEEGLGRLLAAPPVEGQLAAAGGHRAVRVREQDHLRALQGEDAPALEEVAVVADRRPDPAEAEVDDVPLVRLPEAEELVVRRVHLALQAEQGAAADERERVVVRAAVELAEAVADDDAALRRPAGDRLEDAAVARLRVAGHLRAAVVARDRALGEDDEVAARVRGLVDSARCVSRLCSTSR